jgi:hypothetical protein
MGIAFGSTHPTGPLTPVFDSCPLPSQMARRMHSIKWSPPVGTPSQAIVRLDEDLKPRTWLYHRLTWKRALKIFERRALFLVPVSSWTDPYERWWCGQLFSPPHSLEGVQAYGQSWTTSRFDEPAWRMVGFRQDDPIVRIKCRTDAISAALAHSGNRKDAAYYLGRVKYCQLAEIRQLSANYKSGQIKEVSKQAAALLFHKRRAFDFEQEVRLLRLDRGPAKNLIEIPFDPSSVAQVMITPYATALERTEIKNSFRKFGVTTITSGVLMAPT